MSSTAPDSALLAVTVAEAFVAVALAAVAYAAWIVVLKPWKLVQVVKKQGVMAFPFRPIIGNLPEVNEIMSSKKVIDLVHETLDRHNVDGRYRKRMAIMCLGFYPRLVVWDPEVAKEVFVTESHCFHKPRLTRILEPLMGNGLVLSEGIFHHRQRKMIHPAFKHENLRRMVRSMACRTRTHIQRMVGEGKDGAEWTRVDMHPVLSSITLDIIGSAAMGVNTLGEGEVGRTIYQVMNDLLEMFVENIMSMRAFVPLYRYLPTANNRRLNRQLKRAQDVLLATIEERRKFIRKRVEAGLRGMPEDSQREDEGAELLDLLLLANEEGEKKMSSRQLQDEAMTFLFAGHETTAQLMTWAMYLLSQHPEWADRVRKEAEEVLPVDAEDIEYSHLNQLKTTELVLYEVLRLFPPVPVIGREVIKPVTIGGVRLPKGMDVAFRINGMHHDPSLWEDAEEFRPERFKNGTQNAGPHPMAFLPFSAGIRNCIGSNFALMEARIMLPMLLRSLEFKLAPDYEHHPKPSVTLRPKYGMPMYVRRRVRE